MPRIEMDTYLVLDDREELGGTAFAERGGECRLQLAARRLGTDEVGWQGCVEAGAMGASQGSEFALPVASMPGGYYEITAEGENGERSAVVVALRKLRCDRQAVRPGYLAFVRDTVETIIVQQTVTLGAEPGGVPFVTVGRPLSLGYRSLGHQRDGQYVTYWFPERPFEYDTFRADHEMWPILDGLSDATGEAMYADMVTGMLDAIAAHGFDPASGLVYLSQECDFDVRRKAPHSKGAGDQPKFKPLNTGNCPGFHLDRMWRHMPDRMHRCFRSMYLGLITDPRTFDYNRFCSYGFDDSVGEHSMVKNSGHCAFDTAGARMIHWWSSCWRHAGDRQCLEWAQQMADKWREVQHPDSGLVPNFFGAIGWSPGAGQPPGEWAEARGAALAASSFMQGAEELCGRSGAGGLAEQLRTMARALALGVARCSYDPLRRVFREHLFLDGRPWQGTARYCFASEAEKAEAVRQNPELVDVRVYDGAGFYRNPNYYEHCAGSNIPYHLALTARLDDAPDAELLGHLEQFAADAMAEARQLGGAFTPEGRWTFRASGQYIKLCLLLLEMTGEQRFLDWACELADREVAALSGVECPHWWRMRERTTLLDALLRLHRATQSLA